MYFSAHFLSLLLFVYCTAAQAQNPIKLDKNFQTQVLSNHKQLKFYRDTKQTFTLKEARKLNWQTQAFDLNNPVCLPKTKYETIWLHFTLDVIDIDRYVLATFNLYGTSELYFKHTTDRAWRKITVTEEDYYRNRPYHYFFFRQFVLDLDKKGKYECYFKTPGLEAISLSTHQHLEKTHIYVSLILFFTCFGGLLAVTLYNFFLIFATKDRIYTYYSFYQLTNLMIGLLFTGIATAYGLDFTTANYDSRYTTFFFLSYLANLMFAYHFLQVPVLFNKIWKRVFLILMIANGMLIVLAYFVPSHYMQFLAEKTALVITLFTWISGIWAYTVKKKQEARFYIIAYVFYVGGFIMNHLTVSGIYDNITVGYNGFIIGAVLEAIFFSLALGDRIKVLKREKEQAQIRNLQLVEGQKVLLEQKVQERTAALKQANQDIITQNKELKSRREEILAQNEELQQSQEEIAAQHDALQKTNVTLARSRRQIELSINSAKSIQQAILLQEYKFQEYFKDHFVINRPKDVVSGDFFWLDKIQDKVILIVADCTGHGVPGAFMTLIGTHLLDNIIRVHNIHDPATILNRLHIDVQNALHQKQTQNKNGMDAIAITLETPENLSQTKLSFSGAKNNLLIWSDQALLEIKATRKSIGGIQNEEVQFQSQEIYLNQGDMAYLGSDGLEDQNNKKRKRFGRKRLKDLITEIHPLTLPQQKHQFEAVLAEYMIDTDQRDDILLIGVKV